MKKIVLVRHGEVTPFDDISPRYLRTGQMFFHFTSKGLGCEWYTSTFNHFNKRQRSQSSFKEKINEHGDIIYIKSPGYSKNISLARLYDHLTWGIKVLFKVYQNRKDVDVIITSIPIISATFFLVHLANLLNIKIVVEVRDKWPDIFWMSSGGFKRKMIQFLSIPLKSMVKWSIENCSICTVPSLSFSDWLKGFVHEKAHDRIQLSFLGYNKEIYPTFDESDVIRQMKVDANSRKIIVFVGTIGHMFDLETVVRAAEQLDSNGDYFFAMFGSGDTISFWRKKTQNLTNIKFYGWVDKHHIDYLLKNAYIGLAPYINNENFNGHVPNKIMEYTAYGLPILSALKGYVEDYLNTHHFGATYENGDHVGFINAINKISEYKKLDREIPLKMEMFYEEFFKSDKIYDELLHDVSNTDE